MRGRLRIASIDQPVELDGQTIGSESYVAADASGAVFLPRDRVAEAAALADKRAREEEHKLREVEDGADPRTVFGGGRGELR
jgi:regulator of RNase E activity RraA